MTRKKLPIVASLSATLLAGSSGFWSCKLGSKEGRTEYASHTATADSEAVAVQVKLPERKDMSRQVLLPGSIEAFEQATLYAKTAGYLKQIKVDIGDRVRKGEILAEIDVPEMASEYEAASAEVQRAEAGLANAEAELVRARAELDLKKLTYGRLKSVREQEPDVLPQQNVDEAKAQYDVSLAQVSVAESKIQLAKSEKAKAAAARARLATLMDYAKIVAPFDGVVTKRHVDPGALIQHALSQTNVAPIVTVARVDTVRVFVDVPEPEAPFVKKGLPVEFKVDALPGKVFMGTCTRFAGALEPKTRTMRTESDFPNREGVLRPGMYGQATLLLEKRGSVLTVPPGALLLEGGKTYVFTVVDGKAKRVPVRTGFDDGIRVEITEGLTGNEPVIVTGKSAVQDGAPVKVSTAPS